MEGGKKHLKTRKKTPTKQSKDWLCEEASSFYSTLHAETNMFVHFRGIKEKFWEREMFECMPFLWTLNRPLNWILLLGVCINPNLTWSAEVSDSSYRKKKKKKELAYCTQNAVAEKRFSAIYFPHIQGISLWVRNSLS